VGKSVDPTQATRMADYFMQLKQYDKAVDILAAIDRVKSLSILIKRMCLISLHVLGGRSSRSRNST
jgi:hypothetical protein